MIQEILTGIVVSAAFAYTFYSFWKAVFSDNGRACGGGCSSCSAKDLLIKDINKKGKRPKFEQFRPLS
ncbi:FeoB-associated Cys-rich membrane protein [Marinilabilia sp.]|uniref:FeoB-associated Cys-rich membrane protein n=1 Tax=Marinilabilia sp. TaxID=2021252 RepID=UPI0025C444F1|nr:FeoB-associated Cys-rich membrane protein [Marinilabilia sp.]